MLEGPLGKYTPDGQTRSSGFTIKFALTVGTRGNIGADELQATDAAKQASEMVSALSPTPQVVGLADPVINTAINVVTELQTFENTWGVLLQRMMLFNKIVGGIAAVSVFSVLLPLCLNVA